MFELVNKHDQAAVIKVIGVGGGGCNAVDYMYKSSVHGVEFICANTDVQALTASNVPTQLQLGSSITKGLGAGAVPETGRKAALEDRETMLGVLDGADMVFLTAGMGGWHRYRRDADHRTGSERKRRSHGRSGDPPVRERGLATRPVRR